MPALGRRFLNRCFAPLGQRPKPRLWDNTRQTESGTGVWLVNREVVENVKRQDRLLETN
jgi:hypothetical protein